MGGSAFVFAKSETVFHQKSYSLPCCFCSGIMIEVEKTQAFHRLFPWNPLFGNYQRRYGGRLDLMDNCVESEHAGCAYMVTASLEFMLSDQKRPFNQKQKE